MLTLELEVIRLRVTDTSEADTRETTEAGEALDEVTMTRPTLRPLAKAAGKLLPFVPRKAGAR